MNDYAYEDLTIGTEESFSVEITEKMLSNFYAITGDKNPLHHDVCFAQAHGYPGKVVFGMLTASFMSTLSGCYLPGRRCLIHSADASFVRPVYVGDRLTISGTVKAKHELSKQVEIRVYATNQNGEKVMRGLLKVGFLNE